jgi:hypothetical protein
MKKVKSASKWLRDQKRSHLVGASIFMVAFAIIGVAYLLNSFAAGERLYISPATSSVQAGSDVIVTLRLDAGAGVNAIDATVAYDQTKLQFKSVDATASAFTTSLIEQGGNGTVNIVRGITNAVLTGDVEVAKITFTALGSTATTATLTVSGEAANDDTVPLTFTNGMVNITVPQAPPSTTTFTIEPTAAAPLVGAQFGLRVYVTSTATFQGGNVTVNLPTGLAYQGTLDTTGTAFNPATTVAGTNAQLVNLVFVTQSTTMTGKQLIATIPVIGSTVGAKSVTFSGARLADNNNADITPITANPFSITINAASLPAPIVTIPGKTTIAATENITNLKQPFTITNFDSAATYTVTLSGQSLALTSNGFAIPTNIKNGDMTLQVTATKSGASGSSSYTIRLRSPNVNRIACVELLDLLVVNKGYGAASTELDLNFDGTVSLIDLLTVTGNWGGACL